MKDFKAISKAFLRLMLFFAAFIYVCQFLNIAFDSAGNYSQLALKDALSEKKNIDVAFFGTSRTYHGIDAPTLSKKLDLNCFDIAGPGLPTSTQYKYAQEVFNRHKPKTVFIEMSTARLYATPDPEPDTKKKWEDLGGLLEFRHHWVNTFSKFNYRGKGFWVNNSSMDPANAGSKSLPNEYFSGNKLWNENSVNARQINDLFNFVELCKAKGSKVALYSPPFQYAPIGEFAESYSEYHDYMTDLKNALGVEYYDFSLLKDDVFPNRGDHFYDLHHLNGRGATAFAALLTDFYNDVIVGGMDKGEYIWDTVDQFLDNNAFVYSVKARYSNYAVTAAAAAGNTAQVEYQFLYKTGNNFEVFRDYLCDSTASIEELPRGLVTIRVNARTVGNKADFEQYVNIVIET